MTTVVSVPIERISIGERRREDLGDIEGLAESIQRHGLLHPITINREDQLVCGERRLRAFQRLGWETIPAQVKEELTGDRLREVELEENLRRKDLTPYERSRTLADLASLARDHAKYEIRAQTIDDLPGVSAQLGPKLGRPAEAGSGRDVADRVGVPRSDIQRAEQHVALAEAFPVFKQPQWTQEGVLQARKVLARLPEPERAAAVAFVDEPAVPIKDGLAILEEIAAAPPEKRENLFRLHQSPDLRDRELAVTTAAKKAHCPDPRVIVFRNVIRDLQRLVRDFPDDTLNPRLLALIDTLSGLIKEAGQLHQERIQNAI